MTGRGRACPILPTLTPTRRPALAADQALVRNSPVASEASGPEGGIVANVAGATGLPGWQDMELGAPEIARLGVARLNSARVALLGTLRRDGSPRISPIEPYIAQGQLLVGAMAWSRKADDLRRDPRYVLHSAVTGPDSGEGELKLWGTAVEAGQDLRSATADAWWSASPPDTAIVFRLRIEKAVFVEWDTEQGLMTVHRWSLRNGYSQTGRTYP